LLLSLALLDYVSTLDHLRLFGENERPLGTRGAEIPSKIERQTVMVALIYLSKNEAYL
jgi:hypothetical protein